MVMHVRGMALVAIALGLGIGCTSASQSSPTSTPTPAMTPTSTPAPQVRITPLKPGENPWHMLALGGRSAVKLLTSHPTYPGRVYVVAGEDEVLVVSRDRGSTWQTGDLSRIDLVRVAPMDPMGVYAISEQRARLWKSNDGGLNFRRLKTPVQEFLALAVAFSGTDTVYLAGGPGKGDLPAGDGLYRSDDGGSSWAFVGQLPARMGFKGDLLVDPACCWSTILSVAN